MISKHKSAIIWITVSFLFCFLAIGYALVNDELNLFGSLSWDFTDSSALVSGNVFSELVNEIEDQDNTVKRIVFDTQDNQQTMLDNEGLKWNEGTPVQVENCSEIMLHYVASEETVYVLSKGSRTIYANPDCEGMFASLTSVEEIVLHNFETETVTDMTDMFRGCTSLRTIYAMESFDIAGVTASDNMFAECYALYGGMGTYVYPSGAEGAPNSLLCDMARLDGEGDLAGYLTDSFHHFATYFESNVLRPVADGAVQNVYGTEAVFAITNALDSKTFSQIPLTYKVTVYIWKNDAWVEHSYEINTLGANRQVTREFTVTPIEVDGVVYDRILVKAACTNGTVQALVAEFRFQYMDHAVEYSWNSNVIYLDVYTNDDGGDYRFTWAEGIIPDNSDHNLIFTDAVASDRVCDAELKSYHHYEILFIINDGDLITVLNALDADAQHAFIQSLVGVEKVES